MEATKEQQLLWFESVLPKRKSQEFWDGLAQGTLLSEMLDDWSEIYKKDTNQEVVDDYRKLYQKKGQSAQDFLYEWRDVVRRLRVNNMSISGGMELEEFLRRIVHTDEVRRMKPETVVEATRFALQIEMDDRRKNRRKKKHKRRDDHSRRPFEKRTVNIVCYNCQGEGRSIVRNRGRARISVDRRRNTGRILTGSEQLIMSEILKEFKEAQEAKFNKRLQ